MLPSSPVGALLLLHGRQQGGVCAGPGCRLSLFRRGRAASCTGRLGCAFPPAHLPRPLARGCGRGLLQSPCTPLASSVALLLAPSQDTSRTLPLYAPLLMPLLNSMGHGRCKLELTSRAADRHVLIRMCRESTNAHPQHALWAGAARAHHLSLPLCPFLAQWAWGGQPRCGSDIPRQSCQAHAAPPCARNLAPWGPLR